MTSAAIQSTNTDAPPIYLTATQLKGYVANQRDLYLFLDIDGTLAPFTLDPKDTVIPKSTKSLIRDIQDLGVHIAIITGRSLEDAKQLLYPLQLPIAATHGLEILFNGSNLEDKHSESKHSQSSPPYFNNFKNIHSSTTTPSCSDMPTCLSVQHKQQLHEIRSKISESIKSVAELSLEDKPYSCALHYRQNPALSKVAHSIVLKAVEHYSEWSIKPGKCVYEVILNGVNKGSALLKLFDGMMQEHKLSKKVNDIDSIGALFIGDDFTDETGFKSIQNINSLLSYQSLVINGAGIKVGHEPTCATYYVNNIDDVVALLTQLLEILTSCNQRLNSPPDTSIASHPSQQTNAAAMNQVCDTQSLKIDQ